MNNFDKLFAFGSILAAIAGFSEIYASRQRWIDNEKQNSITPLCIMFVKMTRIPKYAVLAKTSIGNALPLISASFALIIWTTSFIYTVLPPAHHIKNKKK